MDATYDRVVLDTNVFVAAGFNPRSHSARLLDAVRLGRLRMVWGQFHPGGSGTCIAADSATVLDQRRSAVSAEDKFEGTTQPQKFSFVPDPADRKLAAKADAARVPLVTSDGGLQMAAAQMKIPVLKPGEFQRRCELAE